jgi:hypothetical protein
MRALAAVVVGAILGGFVAGVVQVQLGIWLNAHEELIAVMVGQTLFVVALATALLLAVESAGTEQAVTIATLVLVAVMLIGLAAIEIAGRLTDPASIAEVIAVDGPLLLEAVLPALITALIQWWMVRRHLRRSRRIAPAN